MSATSFPRTPLGVNILIAGWSSQVARQAHNLKVVGSNPTPVTNLKPRNFKQLRGFLFLARLFFHQFAEGWGGRKLNDCEIQQQLYF